MSVTCDNCTGAPLSGIGSGLNCLRCGHHWHQQKKDPPIYCPRCGSAGWNRTPVMPRARQPHHTPNPNWKKKGRRYYKHRPDYYERKERESTPDPGRVRAGIPHNYILDGAPGIPPPPSMRKELPAPPVPQLQHSEEPPQPERFASQSQPAPTIEFPQPAPQFAEAAASGEAE